MELCYGPLPVCFVFAGAHKFDFALPLIQKQSRFFVECSQVGRIFKRNGPPGGPAEKRMRELACMPAVQCSPNNTTRQTKGSVVCTTVTNTLVQIAISTLPARADGAAAGSGQQGRSSSEGRRAVVQDAEGGLSSRGQAWAGWAWLERLPRHASLEPSVVRSDLSSPRCCCLQGAGPMCRAWCLGVWIAIKSKSALGMPMASLVVPGVAGAEDSQLGQ